MNRRANTQVLKRHPFTVAVLSIVLAILLFDIQGAIIKYMGAEYPIPQIAFLRNLFGMLPSLLALYLSVAWQQRGRSWRVDKWPLALARGGMLAVAQLTFYLAIIHMELATATTLAFAGPLFITCLSVPLLGHRVGLWRSLAVLVGFAGVVLVMRPGMGDFSLLYLLPACAAFCYALVSVSSRLFDDSVPTALLNLYAGVVAVFVMLCVVLFTGNWVPVPLGVDWLWLCAMGCSGGCAVLLMISAYRLSEPSSLSPFEYFGIPFSFALGWLFFDEAPVDKLFPGVILIVGAGLLVIWRERRLAKSVQQDTGRVIAAPE